MYGQLLKINPSVYLVHVKRRVIAYVGHKVYIPHFVWTKRWLCLIAWKWHLFSLSKYHSFVRKHFIQATFLFDVWSSIFFTKWCHKLFSTMSNAKKFLRVLINSSIDIMLCKGYLIFIKFEVMFTAIQENALACS